MRAVVERLDRVGVEFGARDRLGEQGGPLAVERLERELDDVAHPAQLGTQPTQALGVGRHLVAGRDHEQQRQLAQLGRERGKQVQRRLVRPVQVVEQDRDGTGRRHDGERAPKRLDERRGVGVGGGNAELRQQVREVRDERAAGGGHVGAPTQTLTQHLGDRVVRLGDVARAPPA